jgi:hypothetical protein
MKTKLLLSSVLSLGLALGAVDLFAAGPRGGGSGGAIQNRGSTNSNRTPKQDGTGGPGKPANPAGPRDGTSPGPGPRS